MWAGHRFGIGRKKVKTVEESLGLPIALIQEYIRLTQVLVETREHRDVQEKEWTAFYQREPYRLIDGVMTKVPRQRRESMSDYHPAMIQSWLGHIDRNINTTQKSLTTLEKIMKRWLLWHPLSARQFLSEAQMNQVEDIIAHGILPKGIYKRAKEILLQHERAVQAIDLKRKALERKREMKEHNAQLIFKTIETYYHNKEVN